MNKYAAFLLIVFTTGGCVDDYRLRYLGETDPMQSNPVIMGTYPADASDSVSLDTKITVHFSTAMNIATITTNTATDLCTGTVQVSANLFATCVKMSGSPLASNGNKSFSVTPRKVLDPLTVYKLRVTTSAHDTAAQPLAGVFTQASGFTTVPDTTPPTVEFWIADGLTSAYRNMTQYFIFSEPMDIATITTNTADTACSGSLQISSDNFVTCLQMVGTPAAADGIMFGIKPVSNLASLTAYNVRVTTMVRDLAGNPMATIYTMPTGFTTGSSVDIVAPTVISTDPVDGISGADVETTITILFDDNMQPNTVTANNGSDSTCSGSIQVSPDGFTTCVPMKRQTTGQLEQFIFTPLSPLQNGTTYLIRITTIVTDKAGNAMVSDYLTSAGFTTSP